MRIVDPTFTLLAGGEMLAEGIEPGTAFYVDGKTWRDADQCARIINCVWPYELVYLGYKNLLDVYLLGVEEEIC